MSVTTETETPATDECVLTRSEIEETLIRCSALAQREMYVIEKFSNDPPTAWTKAHRRINQWLDDRDKASA